MRRLILIVVCVMAACAPQASPPASSAAYSDKLMLAGDSNVYEFVATFQGDVPSTLRVSASSGPDSAVARGSMEGKLGKARAAAGLFAGIYLCPETGSAVLSDERFDAIANAWDMRVACAPRTSGLETVAAPKEAV